MIKIFDVCKIYKCKTDGGIGYIAEIGESVFDGWSIKLIAVFENLYSEEIGSDAIMNDKHYYITHSLGEVDEEIKGIAKQNKFDGEGFIVDYSFTDYGAQKISNATATVSILGEYDNKLKVSFPKQFRQCEYNFINYSYQWLTMDEKHANVRSQTTDKAILSLPPYFQSVETCLQWWAEGLKVDKWNDDYCRRIILLRKNIDGESDNVMSLEDLASAFEEGESVKIVRLKSILTEFEYGLLKTKSEEKALLLLKKAYSEINKLNSDNFIDTQNREMLFEYFSNRLSSFGFNSVTDRCEKYRDW